MEAPGLPTVHVTILGINYPPEPTGVAPYTGALSSGLQARGRAVRVLTAHPHYPEWTIRAGYGQWTKRELLHGVRVLRLRHYVPKRPAGLLRLLSEISFGLRLLFAKWGRPDVVVMVTPALFSTALALIRAKVSRRPVAVWVQDIYSLGVVETGAGGGLLGRMMSAIEGVVLRAADGVVVIHDRFKAYVVGELGVDSINVEVIRNWTHLDPSREPVDGGALRARLGWNGTEAIALHAGNMGAKQGLENVVQAARLADEENAPVRFVLLGSGSERDRLEAEAAGVQRLQFVDPVDDESFRAALAAADVLVVNERPGVAEMAVPSKLTSYFDAGRPVVAATDPEGITAQEVESAAAGVVVRSGEPASLLNAVLQLRADPERAARLGANGRAYREQVLDQDAAIDHYAEWLANLAAGRR